MADPSTKVVWSPLMRPDGRPTSQAFALDTRAQITVFHGTRGNGKTECQLMRFRRRVGLGYGKKWHGVIFDHSFPNLDDIVLKAESLFYRFGDGAQFLRSVKDYKWVWPTGEELLFRAISKPEDYFKFHGHEFPFIGFNELTKYPTDEVFNKVLSLNRSGFLPEESPLPDGSLLPPIPLEVFATTNPSGPGHNWVKARFIDVAPSGHVYRTTVKVQKPGTDDVFINVEKTQVAIFGSWKENRYLDPLYIATLEAEPNPAIREAWLNGNWDVVSGGAFDDVWRKPVHVLPRFIVPKSWKIDRSFDWGSSHPFWVGWFAEASGESATIVVGSKEFEFCPQPGSIILIAEWYGTQKIGSNKGVRISSQDIARGILEKESAMIERGWIQTIPEPGPADNQIWSVNEVDQDTIAMKMESEGVYWVRSNKSPGSRINGLQLMRDRFTSSVRGEGPGLYFMANCPGAVGTIPTLTRDPKKPEDVDTKSEDHPYDGVRYRVLHGDAPLKGPPSFTSFFG